MLFANRSIISINFPACIYGIGLAAGVRIMPAWASVGKTAGMDGVD